MDRFKYLMYLHTCTVYGNLPATHAPWLLAAAGVAAHRPPASLPSPRLESDSGEQFCPPIHLPWSTIFFPACSLARSLHTFIVVAACVAHASTHPGSYDTTNPQPTLDDYNGRSRYTGCAAVRPAGRNAQQVPPLTQTAAWSPLEADQILGIVGMYTYLRNHVASQKACGCVQHAAAVVVQRLLCSTHTLVLTHSHEHTHSWKPVEEGRTHSHTTVFFLLTLVCWLWVWAWTRMWVCG